MFILFGIYGIYAAATEGISKAILSNIVPRKDVASALGTFSGFQSICLLIASTMTGFIWFKFGTFAAFILPAAAAITVAVYFLSMRHIE
jgi:hypothetical protein